MENQEKEYFKIIDIMQRAEYRPKTAEHLRVYLFSLMDEPEFPEFEKLLEKNPELFDAFAAAFRHKRHFLEHGGTKDEWQHVLDKEKQVFEALK